MKTALINFVAGGFGAGRLPVAPGTAGTLVAIPLALLFSHLPPLTWLLALVLLLPLCAWVCGDAAARGNAKDPDWIVLDEIFGFLVATFCLEPSWGTYGAAFFLFRLFDILKPPPVGWLDRNLRGGWGILLDDVAAGAISRALIAVSAMAGLF